MIHGCSQPYSAMLTAVMKHGEYSIFIRKRFTCDSCSHLSYLARLILFVLKRCQSSMAPIEEASSFITNVISAPQTPALKQHGGCLLSR